MSTVYQVSRYGGSPIVRDRQDAADIPANDMLAMAAIVLADVDDDLYTRMARRLRLLTVYDMSQDEVRETLAHVATALVLLGPDCSKAGDTAIEVISKLAAGDGEAAGKV